MIQHLRSALLPVVFLTAAAADLAQAQPVGPYPSINPQLASFSVGGTTPGGAFGRAVSEAGDLDGDGVPDFMVGAPFDVGPLAGVQGGRIRIFSGATAAPITLPIQTNTGGAANGDQFGHSLDTLGDIDGDGIPDIVAGTDAFPGYVRVLSGATGALIFTPPPLPVAAPQVTVGGFGYRVANAGDVDADGINDIAVGAPFTWSNAANQNGGMVQIYSGATGANLLFAASGGAQIGIFGTYLQYLGIGLAGAGDFNGDGYADVIAGAYNPYGIGFANVYSGRYLTNLQGPMILANLTGQFVTDGFGISVSGAGDVNGDGLSDVVVGSYFGNFAEVFAGSAAVVFSPAPLYAFSPANSSGFGYAVSAGRDVNGDGVPDIVVGGGRSTVVNDLMFVNVYSGANGSLLTTYTGTVSAQFGVAVDLLASINGNAQAEVIVGADQAMRSGVAIGRVTVFLN